MPSMTYHNILKAFPEYQYFSDFHDLLADPLHVAAGSVCLPRVGLTTSIESF